MTQIDHQSLNTVVGAAFAGRSDRFDAALAAFPRQLPEASRRELTTAWSFFAHEVHFHHHYEEQFFWPALGQTDADLSSLAELDSEHDAMRASLAQASAAMAEFGGDPSSAHATAARQAVATLRTVLLGHLGLRGKGP